MKTCATVHRGYCLLGLALLWSWHVVIPAARAQPPPEPGLELDSLIREATANNPEIRAARQRWVAAKAVIPQAKTLPDPLVTFGYEKVVDRERHEGHAALVLRPGAAPGYCVGRVIPRHTGGGLLAVRSTPASMAGPIAVRSTRHTGGGLWRANSPCAAHAPV